MNQSRNISRLYGRSPVLNYQITTPFVFQANVYSVGNLQFTPMSFSISAMDIKRNRFSFQAVKLYL